MHVDILSLVGLPWLPAIWVLDNPSDLGTALGGNIVSLVLIIQLPYMIVRYFMYCINLMLKKLLRFMISIS